MTAAVKTIRRAFRVGKHRAVLSVQFAAGVPAGATVEWEDGPPRLSRADLARYRMLRDAVLQGIADEISDNILIADLEADGSISARVIRPVMETSP